jgi:hypothetical protein
MKGVKNSGNFNELAVAKANYVLTVKDGFYPGFRLKKMLVRHIANRAEDIMRSNINVFDCGIQVI